MSEIVCAQHVDLGRMDYENALARQSARADALLKVMDDQQTVFTVEHPPTITIGRNGSQDNVLLPPEQLEAMGWCLYEVDRGGDVTYHGPGQLVVYPVLHLNPWQNDVGKYVRMLEETILAALLDVHIHGRRDEAYPGVWVGDDKICAVGCRVRRRPTGEFVTYHGLALNVTTDLSHFERIVPCGIQDRGVTSVAQLLDADPSHVSLADWQERVLRSFSQVFDLPWSQDPDGTQVNLP